jgi:predicted alpha/beta hydrolase family esterase
MKRKRREAPPPNLWPRFVLLGVLAVICALVMLWKPAPRATENMSGDLDGKQVYIVHGYMASPSDHWFGWLKTQLEARGAKVSILAMPDSSNPDPAAWQRHLEQSVSTHDGDTYFVAHSLGCIALLHYLQSLPADTRIGGLLLVSGFNASLSLIQQLDNFTNSPMLDADRIIAMSPERAVIASRNDAIVPYALTVDLSRQLQAQLSTVDEGGHFLGSEGFTTLPVAYELLAAMMSARP